MPNWLDDMIKQMNSGAAWSSKTVEYSFPTRLSSENKGVKLSQYFDPLNSAQKAAAKSALAQYAEVSQLKFVQVNGNEGDIRIHSFSKTDGTLAFAFHPGSKNKGDAFFYAGEQSVPGTIYGYDSLEMQLPKRGGYSYLTYMHELGHSLGLKHPGNYDAGDQYEDRAIFQQDTHQYSVMSYFNAMNTGGHMRLGGIWKYPETLMMVDIAAIQAIYGVNKTTRAADTIYGFDTNAGTATPYNFDKNYYPVICIFDAGGEDTLNFSKYNGPTVINLNPGTFSSTPGFRHNVSIAFGTIIENATGGMNSDKITGNKAANIIRGGYGDDWIYGGDGDDIIYGGANGSGISTGDGKVLDNTAANTTRAKAYNLSGEFLYDANSSLEPSVIVENDGSSSGPRDVYRFDIYRVGAKFALELIDIGRGMDFQIRYHDADGKVLTATRYGILFENVAKLGAQYISVRGPNGESLAPGAAFKFKLTVFDELNPRVGLGEIRQHGEILKGEKGNDRIYGQEGDDTIQGGTGNDYLSGGEGSDLIEGNSGSDRLVGGSANDALTGGSGRDYLYGGSGADHFTYKSIADSTVTAEQRDTIFDFSRSQSDRIVLSAIDANAKLSGNQAFKFIETAGFGKKAGELRYVKNKADTYVYGDIDGDGKADFAIHLDKAITLAASDFVL